MEKLKNNFEEYQASVNWDQRPVCKDMVCKEFKLKHGLKGKELGLAQLCSSRCGVILVCLDTISYSGEKEIDQNFRVYGLPENVSHFIHSFGGVYKLITKLKNRVENYKLVKGDPIKLAEKLMTKAINEKIKIFRSGLKESLIDDVSKNEYMYNLCENVILMEKLNFKRYNLKTDTPRKRIKCAITNEYKHRRILKWE